MKKYFWKLTLLLPLICASCVGTREEVACPQIAVLRELKAVNLEGGIQALLQKGESACYERKDGAVSVRVDVLFAGQRQGEVVNSVRAQIPFFAALLDSEDNVVAKTFTTTQLAFSGDSPKAEATETIRLSVPRDLAVGEKAGRVVLGFQIPESALKAQRKNEDEWIAKKLQHP